MIIFNATSSYLKRYLTHSFVNNMLVDDTKNVVEGKESKYLVR